jgi:hypothetical protein
MSTPAQIAANQAQRNREANCKPKFRKTSPNGQLAAATKSTNTPGELLLA